ncbi:hypothetical protein CLV72_104687 [Allonocardiopsis opalescens]|uniref:Uncharacterized protein n=1 Tax=Allonocardiopsis opalescens TaxID=1144618 RepID=A0A2T0Q5K9_9ACTN|nr:hypothetical protein CLV72_104687 [Allonocardiopsis opalescens]
MLRELDAQAGRRSGPPAGGCLVVLLALLSLVVPLVW